MGLNTTHDCFNGSYTRFYKWRRELCRAADISYECGPRNRTMAEQNGDWAETPDDILYVLIDHADCEGHILAEHCAPLPDACDALGLLEHPEWSILGPDWPIGWLERAGLEHRGEQGMFEPTAIEAATILRAMADEGVWWQ